MSKSKKYAVSVEQHEDTWKAQILRQVTSRKTAVSKQRDGFASREEAEQWGTEQLAEFTKVQSGSNVRHGEQRKSSSETKLQRSARRAEKTALAKAKALEESEKEKESAAANSLADLEVEGD